MAIGDQVILGENSIFTNGKTEFLMAYTPVLDSDGAPLIDNHGYFLQLKKLGGVKVGSRGKIIGHCVKAPSSQLAENQLGYQTNFVTDYVDMVPVELTEYRQVAWFPTNKLRITLE